MAAQVHHYGGQHARRPPFVDAANQPTPHIPTAKAKPSSPLKRQVQPQEQQQQQKAPSSPPLPRQNSKTLPPSPPQIIRDNYRSMSFSRVGFLGEGGFARVYEAEDTQGVRHAIKVVTKDSLKTKKAKTKLYAEIKIHRSLNHPNIVKFEECFEDPQNVYMTLELCQSGSLMDMLRRRRRFTEPEARYFSVQLLGACHYMHSHQVIHRDLKLGNLFLDVNMNVKVGDFGLAALIENPGERKKTICGTPNYIAPEVLFDTANGHSFEVDTWSIGVILYTLVVGRPPFQTKDVKAIYKRIRDNQYEFPTDREISGPARELIQQILTPNPQERPTLLEILDHAFFTHGTVPAYIPTSAQDMIPSFRHITRAMSINNLARLRKYSMLEEDQVSSVIPSVNVSVPGSTSLSQQKNSVAQQEREFQKAVQPSSPISALLGAARQPFLVSTSGAPREQPLIRKLQAAAKEKAMASPARSISSQVNGGVGSRNARRGLHDIEEEQVVADQEHLRRKELESQKARIVAQMVPAPAPETIPSSEDIENLPPRKEVKVKEAPKDFRSSTTTALSLDGFALAAQTLTAAFDAKAKGKVFRDPRDDADLPEAKVFIVSWVDYCNKYGMGYALTDGSVGVHFNDSTSIVLSPDKHHLDYVSSRRSGAAYVRKHHSVADYPEELKSKVYLLKHFERYIMERLYGDYPYTFEDLSRTKGMAFVQKYLRMKHVIVFKMCHDVLQFNFYDHTKVILSSQGLLVTHIDKEYQMKRWTLSEIMTRSINPPIEDVAETKFHGRLLDKLKYCKEVLLSIKNAADNLPESGSNINLDNGLGMH